MHQPEDLHAIILMYGLEEIRWFRLYFAVFSMFILVGVFLNTRLLLLCSNQIDSNLKDSAITGSPTVVAVVDTKTAYDLYQNEIQKRNLSSMDIQMNFKDDSWKLTFESQKNAFAREYLKKTVFPQLNPPSDLSSYSEVTVVKGQKDVKLLNLVNVCYDFYEHSMQLYAEKESDINIRLIPENFPAKAYSFHINQTPFPADGSIDEENSYILFSHSNRNIAHFTEVFDFIYHYFHRSSSYPHPRAIYFPQYEKGEVYPWITAYVDTAMDLFPKEAIPHIYYLNDMSPLEKNGKICFRHIIGVGRISSVFYGGVFTSYNEVDTLRAASYKHYAVDIQVTRRSQWQVLLIQRESIHGNLPGRAFANIHEIRRFFFENPKYVYTEQKLELLSPSQQVALLSNTDIFVAVLGSGLLNVMYMLPHSVVISYSPPNIGGFFFHTLAEYARVYYIGVYNSTGIYPPECKNRINSNGESSVRACLDVLYMDNVYVEMEEFSDYFKIAENHLESQKYM